MVHSPHEGPVMRITFPCNDIITISCTYLSWDLFEATIFTTSPGYVTAMAILKMHLCVVHRPANHWMHRQVWIFNALSNTTLALKHCGLNSGWSKYLTTAITWNDPDVFVNNALVSHFTPAVRAAFIIKHWWTYQQCQRSDAEIHPTYYSPISVSTPYSVQ